MFEIAIFDMQIYTFYIGLLIKHWLSSERSVKQFYYCTHTHTHIYIYIYIYIYILYIHISMFFCSSQEHM